MTSVIIHEGDSEQGHYNTLNKRYNSNNWFLCNNKEIQNFNIDNIEELLEEVKSQNN